MSLASLDVCVEVGVDCAVDGVLCYISSSLMTGLGALEGERTRVDFLVGDFDLTLLLGFRGIVK